jgi:hypothetical protein
MMKSKRTSEYHFSKVVCNMENGSESLQGSLLLTSARLMFTSKQNVEIKIPLESITKMQGRRGGLLPSLEIQWDDGVISNKATFLQDSIHFGRKDNIAFIPNIVRAARLGDTIC